jgi:hypothetical protein
MSFSFLIMPFLHIKKKHSDTILLPSPLAAVLSQLSTTLCTDIVFLLNDEFSLSTKWKWDGPFFHFVSDYSW